MASTFSCTSLVYQQGVCTPNQSLSWKRMTTHEFWTPRACSAPGPLLGL